LSSLVVFEVKVAPDVTAMFISLVAGLRVLLEASPRLNDPRLLTHDLR